MIKINRYNPCSYVFPYRTQSISILFFVKCLFRKCGNLSSANESSVPKFCKIQIKHKCQAFKRKFRDKWLL